MRLLSFVVVLILLSSCAKVEEKIEVHRTIKELGIYPFEDDGLTVIVFEENQILNYYAR